MKSHSEESDRRAALREKLVGLGESSVRKTYYPELQQRLEELRDSEEFLSNIIDNIPAMVFVKDAGELRFQTFNRAGEELLGFSRQELHGKNDYDFFPPDQADFFTAKDREVLSGRQLVDIPEETIKTRDGRTLILHTKKIPLLDSCGRPQYLLGISEDITERKQLAQQLLQSQKMEAVGHLASGVAHDFNNILMVIMGCGSSLLGSEMDPSQRHRVETILDAAEKAAQLTRNLLAFGRRQPVSLRLGDVNEIVRHVQNFLVRIIGEDIRIETRLATERLLAQMDSAQIEQVLINLATNARDAMPRGGRLLIETGLQTAVPPEVQGGSPSPHVCIAVSDTGTGMDEATINRIFEPFFTTKEPGKGTGLGMSIVLGIIRQHHGFIDIVSSLNAGTTFRIFLPLAANAPPPAECPLPSFPLVRGRGETILVAEDDPMVAQMIRDVLCSCGYQVLMAEDGQEAVELFGRHPEIALVLMDLVMPRLNGKEAADRMRALVPEVPIIHMSGYTRETIEHRDALVEEGTLLMKPVMPQVLLQRIRQVLDR